jgi:hypothetical protein
VPITAVTCAEAAGGRCSGAWTACAAALPHWADWRVDVTTSADGFRFRYTDPADAARSVTVAIGTPDLTAFATLTYPAFHGDQRSLYASRGQTLMLVWHEPGIYDHVDRSHPGVPYELTATGFTDAEFWRIANSLR